MGKVPKAPEWTDLVAVVPIVEGQGAAIKVNA